MVRARFGALLSACLTACAAAPGDSTQPPTDALTVDDLYIVDCLLPGQVRQLGNRAYLSPRRPVRTTAADCRVRGGEYVAYDRADLNSALRVWMTEAEAGDADAQNTVGEIFERGLGGTPNYEAAAVWYEKAASQGHPAAQLNLGALYEQGRGVPQDRLRALNLYRESWGLTEDNVIYQSAANREIQAIRDELNQKLDEQRSQIRLLERQIDSLQQETGRSAEAEQELRELRAWVARIREEQAQSEQQLARTREPSLQAEPDVSYVSSRGVSAGNRNFGRFYALVIGNQNYDRMEDLASPISDATRVARILRDKYGFTVQLVTDANDLTVMQAMNNLRGVIGEEDNLLIYYAGHGSRISAGRFEIGYWLPTNADRPPDDTRWVPTEQVTKVMATTPAKRVLVIADSCYAGLLGEDPATRFSLAGNPAVYRSSGFINLRFPKRSRLLISSGGDMPVLDDQGNGNSVFANAFIDALESNEEILTTPALFIKVRQQAFDQAADQEFEQVPEIKAIVKAGHESGDFFFVPDTGESAGARSNQQ